MPTNPPDRAHSAHRVPEMDEDRMLAKFGLELAYPAPNTHDSDTEAASRRMDESAAEAERPEHHYDTPEAQDERATHYTKGN